MNRILIFILLLVSYLYFFKKYESYEGNFITSNNLYLPNNQDISININSNKLKTDINLMKQMIECIDCVKDSTICELDCKDVFKIKDKEITFYKMSIILYETYINEFLDLYVTKRFNLKKYISIKYQYPENKYDELINLFLNLKSKIEFIDSIINEPNFFQILFSETIREKALYLNNLQEIYETISSQSSFSKSFINNIIDKLIKNYLNFVLKDYDEENFTLGFKYVKDIKSKNENEMIMFSKNQIKEENLIDIIESIERMLENEINEVELMLENQS